MTAILLFVLGVCFGSFVNALVWRLHEQINSKSKKKQKELSILSGRSMCPDCRHELAWYDLIPVISWITLRGRCRYCQKKISIQYPLVELIAGLVFVFSYLFWPISLDSEAGIYSLASWLVASVGLLALAVYDFKWMRLPSIISTILIFFTITARLGYIYLFEADIKSVLISWLLSVAVAAGFFLTLFLISKGKWIGDGDITLGLILGTVLADPLLSIFMIFLASVGGLIFSLRTIMSSKNKMKIQIPFGPYLIASSFFTLLFGQQLIDWYKNLLIV